ncbi:MAG: 50S ribosomal protein L11 methyltransferase, partial [Pseudomonadota bacterium]|nr:50S ribosomal protein L11 methyltransferase [Pseudomonadota bacterium]
MSWRVTLACTRAEAEALPDADDLFAFSDAPPVLVADEPDPDCPDDWRLHAYFEEQPSTQELILLRRLAAGSDPELEHLGESDWVTL